jgi:hypothetical protein
MDASATPVIGINDMKVPPYKSSQHVSGKQIKTEETKLTQASHF